MRATSRVAGLEEAHSIFPSLLSDRHEERDFLLFFYFIHFVLLNCPFLP